MTRSACCSPTHRLWPSLVFIIRPLGCACALALGLWVFCGGQANAQADNEQPAVEDGPWVSAVVWQDDEHLLGTRSQGLLFRSAEVVRAAAENPDSLETVGQSETSLWALVALPDGRVVASDYKGGVHLFGGDQPKQFELDARWIRALTPSPDKSEILAGTEDGKLLVLNVADAKESRRVDAHEAAIFDIAFSTAGDRVATVGGDGSVKLFSWPQLEPQSSMSIGSDAVWSVVFVDNDQHLVTGGADRTLELWEVASGKPIVSLTMAHNWVTSLVALPDDRLVVAGCMDGSLIVADFRSMRGVTSQAGPGSAIWSLALSPDGGRLAAGTRKHGIALVDASQWEAAAAAVAAEADAVRPPAPKK